jgi:hypothetical protein
MILVYTSVPNPTLNLVDDDVFDWTLKSIGVSSLGAANKIADAVANGLFTADDLMATDIATGSDIFTKFNLDPPVAVKPTKEDK